jgi:hypothetical protein
MFATQSCVSRPKAPRRVARACRAACAALLLVAGLSTQTTAAQEPTAKSLFAPIEDVLSASSWMLVSGQDPRYIGSATPWTSGTSERGAEASPAASPSQIITQQLGAIPVSAEPNLAVDPLDPEHLVLGVSALDLPAVATYVSFDGGDTWSGPNQAPYFPRDAGSVGGPAVAFGSDGAVYLVSESVGFEDLEIAGSATSFIPTRIAVSKSSDGGVTWDEPVSVAVAANEAVTASDASGQTASTMSFAFLDRPTIEIGPDPQRPERDIISVAYTEFRVRYSAVHAADSRALSLMGAESTIRLARSTDGGQSWSDPIAISPTAARNTNLGAAVSPAPAPNGSGNVPPLEQPASAPSVGTNAEGDQVVQGPQAVLLPDGTIAVAYFDSTRDGPQQGLARIMAAVSNDGGRTFGEPMQAGLFREISVSPRTAFFRWWSASFPRVAAGPDGELYIAVTARTGDRPADDGDVLLLRSLDGGANWESPLPISADETNASQFFPAIAVTSDGTLHAMWADMRDDPHGVSYIVYQSQSVDKGQTWQAAGDEAGAPDGRVSDAPANSLLGFPGGRFLGDQFAIAVSDEGVSFAWADTRLAAPSNPNQQIGFARWSPND